MLIALTGTPGVGKTTASYILRDHGHNILDLNQIAEENGFIAGYDEKRDSKIIDLEKLDDYVLEHYAKEDYIVEGHLSHLLSVDMAIILRCDPLVLKDRLVGKKWPETKINENVEAEVLDVIKVEAHETVDKIYEVDTTNKTYEEIADAIEEIIDGKYEDPNIDWHEKYEYLLFD